MADDAKSDKKTRRGRNREWDDALMLSRDGRRAQAELARPDDSEAALMMAHHPSPVTTTTTSRKKKRRPKTPPATADLAPGFTFAPDDSDDNAPETVKTDSVNSNVSSAEAAPTTTQARMEVTTKDLKQCLPPRDVSPEDAAYRHQMFENRHMNIIQSSCKNVLAVAADRTPDKGQGGVVFLGVTLATFDTATRILAHCSCVTESQKVVEYLSVDTTQMEAPPDDFGSLNACMHLRVLGVELTSRFTSAAWSPLSRVVTLDFGNIGPCAAVKPNSRTWGLVALHSDMVPMKCVTCQKPQCRHTQSLSYLYFLGTTRFVTTLYVFSCKQIVSLKIPFILSKH